MTKRKSRAMPKGKLASSNAATHGLAAKYADRLANAGAASAKGLKQRRHTAEVLKQDEVDERVKLLAEARSGDEYAQWQADELFGSSWRIVSKRKVA